MDSESPLPAKRLRASLNGNLHLTQCVREFKLTQQFPSMVTKVSTDAINNKNKIRHNFNSVVTCLAKTPINTTTMTNQEIPATNVIRKIKLKGKDGRDLGEVNVQDLPQNIQGKTITLAKNGITKSPEIILPTDKSKGITIGVLTPVNLQTEKSYTSSSLSLTCVNKDLKEKVDAGKDNKKTVIIEQKQMSAVMDQQGRPQVLVFQSGKNWHMVKLATSGPAQDPQNGKNTALGKLSVPLNCGKATILQANKLNQNVGRTEGINSGSEKSLAGSNNVSSKNHTSMVVKRWSQYGAPESERYKSKSLEAVENGESKPKIEISRLFGSSGNKPVSHIQPVSPIQTVAQLPSGNAKSPLNLGYSPHKNASLRQDVMVVLPSDIPASLDSDTELLEKKDVRSIVTKPRNFEMIKTGRRVVSPKLSMTSDPLSASRVTRKPAGGEVKNDEISSHLNILTKALSTVEDKELRAKALKALADCGIGMERFVPIRPASEQRSVKDSDTQTPVFGVVEPEHFIYVTPDSSTVERISPIKRKAPQKIGHIIGNPHFQELSLNNPDMTKWITPDTCSELASMVEGYLLGNEEASEVRSILASSNPMVLKLASQLEEDFQTYKKYDENGLLNIHRAVVTDDLWAVTRHLKVLRACNESPDLPTTDGETSLELAIRYEVSPKIVKTLLDFQAEPTSSEMGHDSALIIASKKSLPILKDLIPYVKSRKSLDNYDSTGFTALHYCAQNNDKSGVIELVRASADVNARDRRSGRTPLFHAIENEHIELAQLLLDKGAQANIASYSGHTVFALVEEGKHYSLVESLNRAGKSNERN